MTHPLDAEVKKEKAAKLQNVAPGAPFEYLPDKARRLVGGDSEQEEKPEPVAPREPPYP